MVRIDNLSAGIDASSGFFGRMYRLYGDLSSVAKLQSGVAESIGIGWRNQSESGGGLRRNMHFGAFRKSQGQEGIMSGLNNLKPQRVVKAFEKADWQVERTTGSHVILAKPGSSRILSVPVHKGKPIKQGLLRNLISVAGLSVEEFLQLYR